jgi:predicted unusual protein kinase regulating ubiquinone biosynthesis (AarF/ABC1/UbiB family)
MDGFLRLNRAGIYYNDIHPGNFLFTDESVYLIDFGGAFTREEEGDGPDLFTMVPAVRSGDRALVARRLTEFGSLERPTEPELDEMMTLHRDVLLKPFMDARPFRFTPDFAREVVTKQFEASRTVPRLGLPKRAYLGSMRIFWSLYSLLGELGAEADWRTLLESLDSGKA